MAQEVTFERFTTPEHEAATIALKELALKLNRASVLIILSAKTKTNPYELNQYRVVASHVLSATSTLSSIITLTEQLSLQVKEALALARIFYETCLVGCFCAIDEGERANRAELNSIYKTFRKQTQVKDIGSFTFKVSKSYRLDRKDPRVKEALDMFGGSSSSLRPCFTESREEMTKLISCEDTQAGILFTGIEAMTFDVSSEIIHGSYHGFELFERIHNGIKSRRENIVEHYNTVFFTICLSISALAIIINGKLVPSKYFESLESEALKPLHPYAEGLLSGRS